MKDINMPEEQIVHHYFVDLWADMCKYAHASSNNY